MTTRKQRIPYFDVRAVVQPESIDVENRTVEMIWSTGSRVKRVPWFSDPYFEELSMDEKSVRMQRLASGTAPFLNVHRKYDLSDVIGVIESASLGSGQGRCKVRFSKREDVEQIWQDVKNGILRNVSVGYAVHKYERQPMKEGEEIPVYRATDWEPMEVSLVPIGADAGANLRSLEERSSDCEFINNVADERGEEESQMKVRTENENPGTQSPAGGEDVEKVKREAATEATKAERSRVSEIQKAVRTAKLDDKFAEKLITDGVTIDEARKLIIDEWSTRGDKVEVRSSTRVEGGDVAMIQQRKEAIENALLNRHNPRAHALTDGGREFRGMSLMEIARACVEASGVSTRGMDKMTLAARAMHSTSDFPEVLANVAGKTLRQAYEHAPRTYTGFVREVENPDFKQVSRVALGGAPDLEKVLEGGEFKRGTIAESAEKYQLATFGKVVAITRQTIINDDLDAFTRIPELFGRSAADLESDTVYGILTANAAMSDGVALFHADHKNLAAAAAIADATLTEMRKLFRLQKNLDKKRVLNITPQFLIVPAALETIAKQFMAKEILPTKASDVNTHKGTLEVVVESRLDADSATKWYGAASPSQIDTIELAYLQGQRGVMIETRNGFDVDGVEIKARMDLAAKAIDHRGLFRNG